MKKMPCVFVRDFTNQRNPILTKEKTPGCEWVFAGEGLPTRKYDGTSCAIINGVLYKRYDAKRGKVPPTGSIPCDPDPDPITGHWPHWTPLTKDDKYHLEVSGSNLPDGTYELCGPKVNGNSEELEKHILIPHGKTVVNAPRFPTWENMQEFLRDNNIEGVVWHHPDGRMAKLRRDDYGLPWKKG
jgi:hypothetical protein